MGPYIPIKGNIFQLVQIFPKWDIRLYLPAQVMVLSVEAQKLESSLTDNTGQTRSQVMSDIKDSYPDLYLPVVENYKISDKFYGYSDSLSADNN